MAFKRGDTSKLVVARGDTTRATEADLPLPTMRFRRRAWLLFQRALDPLAPPKELPTEALRPLRHGPPEGG
jgi:hypothetical protein